MTEQVKTWLLRAVARDIGHDTEDESDWAASDMVSAAADELDALRAAVAWRDISPEHYGLEGIAWNGVCSGEVVSERGVWHWMNGMRCDPQPTLWMPLPPDPAA